MFFPKRDPAALDAGRFTALRVSLNAPVVSTEELPAGPARAAIVQWWQRDERIGIEVRLRPVAGGGKMVVYGYDGPLEAASDIDHAFEAALNFAEGMGFLFDEDVLSNENTVSRARVVEAWTRFEQGLAPELGPREVLGTPGEALGADELPELAELELTELAPGTVPPVSPHDAALAEELASDWTPIADADAPKAPAAPVVAKAPALPKAPPTPKAPAPKAAAAPVAPKKPAPQKAASAPAAPPAQEPAPAPATLSKFRGRPARAAREAAPAPAADDSGRGKTLGRVPLVRRRGEGGRPRPGLLVRILGAF